MLVTSVEDNVSFLEQHVLLLVRRIAEVPDCSIVAFTTLSQAVEILGAYFDNKPMRSPQQSAKRFEAALRHLFPPAYSRCNKSNFLYHNLRTCLTHTFAPGAGVKLCSGNDDDKKLHLQDEDGVKTITLTSFLADFETAVKVLISRLYAGKVKPKKLLIPNFN